MRIFGLTGFPLGHSFSPDYFKQKFISLGLEGQCDYRLFPFEDVSEIRATLSAAAGLEGLNVTLPHKSAIIPFLDETDSTAAAVGAVNTIRIFPDGRWIGYNTDIIGFRKSISPFLRTGQDRALILGTGGSSRAVQYVLKDLGIDYFLVSRAETDAAQRVISYSDLQPEFASMFGLIINTTPVGMWPGTHLMPDFPVAAFRSGQLVVDLIYRPAPTLFLQKAREAGADILDGNSMLRLQADASWEIWNK